MTIPEKQYRMLQELVNQLRENKKYRDIIRDVSVKDLGIAAAEGMGLMNMGFISTRTGAILSRGLEECGKELLENAEIQD